MIRKKRPMRPGVVVSEMFQLPTKPTKKKTEATALKCHGTKMSICDMTQVGQVRKQKFFTCTAVSALL